MELSVNVIKQKLKLATNSYNLVAGSQQFVKFIFNLSDEWDGLLTFAQFIQDSNSYNAYLDENNSVYLPHEIQAGTCKVILYGTGSQGEGSQIIATTNYLKLNIDENIAVANANSIDISKSLYDQLVNKFNQIVDLSESDYSDLIIQQVEAIMAGYLNDGSIAAATIENGSITRAKVNSAFETTLSKADTAMQPNVYDTLNRAVDVYDFAIVKATAVQNDLNTTKNEIATAHTVIDPQTNTSVTANSLQEAITRAISISENYTNAKSADTYTRNEILEMFNNFQNTVSPKWTQI